jgi:hypothetical protein
MAIAVILYVVLSGSPPVKEAQPRTIQEAPSPTPTGQIRLENKAVGPVTEIIPPERAQAKSSDGAGFLGYDFVPKSTTSKIRVHVVAHAYATEDNIAVLTVFRSGQAEPEQLVSKQVSANSGVDFDFTFSVLVYSEKPISLYFRMGPGRDGTIIFNGPESAPQLSFVEIADE